MYDLGSCGFFCLLSASALPSSFVVQRETWEHATRPQSTTNVVANECVMFMYIFHTRRLGCMCVNLCVYIYIYKYIYIA